MDKCKHDLGWCLVGNTNVFIFDKNNKWHDPESVMFGYTGRRNKLVFGCNHTHCDKVRNVYLSGKVVTWGKIRHPKSDSEKFSWLI